EQNKTYSQCMRYDINWTNFNFKDTADLISLSNDSLMTIPCDKGWEYNQSEVPSSVVIEFISYSKYFLDLGCNTYYCWINNSSNISNTFYHIPGISGSKLSIFCYCNDLYFLYHGLVYASRCYILHTRVENFSPCNKFLPESPRWLLTKGRLLEANDILHNLARVNGTEIPTEFCMKMHSQIERQKSMICEDDKSGPNVLDLFKTPNMRLKTCLITLNW
ncbi:hypothetical protein TSAR_016134, partial [Trichomalopsis sarcophagae]